MRKVKKVLSFHFDEGRSGRAIARQCGFARRSVAQTLERFAASGLSWPEAGQWHFVSHSTGVRFFRSPNPLIRGLFNFLAEDGKGARRICEIHDITPARRSQKSSKRLLSTAQRRAMMALAPVTVQRMPPCLRRAPTMCLQPPSTTPVATHRPIARNLG